MQATVAIEAQALDELLCPGSGMSAITFQLAYPEGHPNNEKELFDVVRIPKEAKENTLRAVHEKYHNKAGFQGCILNPKKDIMGIRVRKNDPACAALYRAVGVPMPREDAIKFKITDIPLHLATKSQMQDCLHSEWALDPL